MGAMPRCPARIAGKESGVRGRGIQWRWSGIQLLAAFVMVFGCWSSVGHSYSIGASSPRDELTVLDVSDVSDDDVNRNRFAYVVPVTRKSEPVTDDVTRVEAKKERFSTRSHADQKMMDDLMKSIAKKGMDSQPITAGALVKHLRMMAQNYAPYRGRLKSMRFGVSRKRSEPSYLESLLRSVVDEREGPADETGTNEETERLVRLLNNAIREYDENQERSYSEATSTEFDQ